jgi:hypothetical protein
MALGSHRTKIAAAPLSARQRAMPTSVNVIACSSNFAKEQVEKLNHKPFNFKGFDNDRIAPSATRTAVRAP